MFTGILLLGATLLPPSDSTPPKTLAARRLAPGEAAPVLDGRLDDAAWAQAPVAGGFVQTQPHPGQPATERTEAPIVYDGGAVYVAMRAYDAAPDSIAAQPGRRDAGGIYSDWLHVVLDSYHDRRTGYRLSVNPCVKLDASHFNDGSEDSGWDAVWDVATRMDSAGWTAEFRGAALGVPSRSTLFGVWSKGREHYAADGSFRPGRDFRRRFGMDDAIYVPATNVLMIEFNYWLDL